MLHADQSSKRSGSVCGSKTIADEKVTDLAAALGRVLTICAWQIPPHRVLCHCSPLLVIKNPSVSATPMKACSLATVAGCTLRSARAYLDAVSQAEKPRRTTAPHGLQSRRPS